MAATTMDTDLFDDVRDARSWIEAAVEDGEFSREQMDVPTEQLEELGYI
ncbi:hypothetical protein [Halorhabdus salina]|nr:hypothetical protein [Halorhabdus salina]